MKALAYAGPNNLQLELVMAQSTENVVTLVQKMEQYIRSLILLTAVTATATVLLTLTSPAQTSPALFKLNKTTPLQIGHISIFMPNHILNRSKIKLLRNRLITTQPHQQILMYS